MKKLVPMLLVTAVLVACSKPTVLHQSMEDMGSSFKPMFQAESIEAIEAQMAGFEAGLEVAKKEQVKPEDQATFEEGIKELEALLAELQVAVAAKDFAKSKEIIGVMGETRKEYHKKLGVKKK